LLLQPFRGEDSALAPDEDGQKGRKVRKGLTNKEKAGKSSVRVRKR
jgi:hypothetical protein